ncbi:MAG TPA: D-Ala-D-Ala carboxypeptidase family metallohydrolase, partial [Candidatus Binatia bacterium]|nr:D-Ala-D-Ala carboxypeptidase family metallohydrolase [Candidatus Binatia bacterium]
RIGSYPHAPFKLLPIYHLPRGFIEVTPANENVLVSPHFRLQQFLCKQEGEYPKYLALDARLLLVLESVLHKVNETGYRCPTFAIMSGYRTPYYNRAIGNSTTYSRHTLGDAADIFIDTNPQDGEMDDLNRDGVVNFRDTKVLYNIVSKMYEPRVQRFLTSDFMDEPRVQQFLAGGLMSGSPLQQLLTGGLARYRETSAHGPFVHVDVRGIYTRWGQ